MLTMRRRPVDNETVIKKGCPRCGGNLLKEMDVDGKYVDKCLQCSYYPRLAVILGYTQPIAEPRHGIDGRKKRYNRPSRAKLNL